MHVLRWPIRRLIPWGFHHSSLFVITCIIILCKTGTNHTVQECFPMCTYLPVDIAQSTFPNSHFTKWRLQFSAVPNLWLSSSAGWVPVGFGFYVCRLSHDSLVVTPWEFMCYENNCTMTGFTAVCIPWRNASSKECFLEAMQKHRVLCCSWKSHGKAGSNLAHLQAVGMYSRFMITLTFSVWYQYSKLLVTMQVIP